MGGEGGVGGAGGRWWTGGADVSLALKGRGLFFNTMISYTELLYQ